MSPKGVCPQCQTKNEYSKVVCDFCGSRLPWADAVQNKITPQKPHAPRAPGPHGATLEQERLAGRLNETLDKTNATRDKVKDYVQTDEFKEAAKKEADGCLGCFGQYVACGCWLMIAFTVILTAFFLFAYFAG